MRRIRAIYRGVDDKWHLAHIEWIGRGGAGFLILSDGQRISLDKVARDAVRQFTATCSVEELRLVLGLPAKMSAGLSGEWEFEGFRYRLFSAAEAKERTRGSIRAQRFCIWCDACEEWVPAGRRFQERHLRPLWLFKAEAERT